MPIDITELYSPDDKPGSGGGGDYVPPGNYEVAITAAEMVPTRAQNGQFFLELELTILQGDHANSVLIDRLNLVNNNDKAVKIARETLAAIRVATGVLSPATAEDLFDRPMLAIVKDDIYERQNDQGEFENITKSIVKRYKKLDDDAAQVGPVQQPQTQQQPSPGHMPRGTQPAAGGPRRQPQNAPQQQAPQAQQQPPDFVQQRPAPRQAGAAPWNRPRS